MDWRAANRVKWDERVAVHLGAPSYELATLRAGKGRLGPIEEAELGSVAGLRILHLQCHFGRDTLILAQQGAEVVGLDFSGAAIAAARRLAEELGLASRVRFVEADLYAAPEAVPPPHGFDLVFTTWGTIGWLPDIKGWARVVRHFLRPGGALYFAELHPAAAVFDDEKRLPDGMPGFFAPYFGRAAIVSDDTRDYADPAAQLVNTRQYEWIHPLADVVSALLGEGLTLEFLHEHDGVPARFFAVLEEDGSGMWRWPDKPWLPLAYSLRARLPK